MVNNQDSFEYQYADSLQNILRYGELAKNRTGIDTLSVQHQYFFLQHIEYNFPIIKGKKVFPKMALTELMWMMNGRIDVKWLQNRGVNYWNEWAGEDGTIGKSYGKQFRDFNGIDQLKVLINDMSKNPESRRLILNLWNVNDINEMRLPPCFMNFRFACIRVEGTIDYVVDLHVTSRSEDSFIGQPYDFMFAAWFLKIMCFLACVDSEFNYRPRHVHYTAEDYHMYVNHKEQVLQYLNNVNENRNNVIQQLTQAKIGYMALDSSNPLNLFLSNSDILKYENFKIIKDYRDEYGSIKAPIAV